MKYRKFVKAANIVYIECIEKMEDCYKYIRDKDCPTQEDFDKRTKCLERKKVQMDRCVKALQDATTEAWKIIYG